MRAKSITDFRKTIAADLDQVVDDHVPLLITRAGGKPPAVVMSLDDFSSWQETAYLLGNPANKQRLIESIAELEAGKVIEVPFPG
jgi:antitoxin YefM